MGPQGAEAAFSSPSGMFSSALLAPASADPVAGLVYVGANDGTLYAFNGASGTVVWRYPTRGAVLGSAALDAATGAIFFGSADGNAYCLDAASGALRWARRLGAPAMGAAALSADGLSLALGAADGALYCLRAADGALLWRYVTGGPMASSPAARPAGGWLVGSADGRLHAVDAAGAAVWSTLLAPDAACSAGAPPPPPPPPSPPPPVPAPGMPPLASPPPAVSLSSQTSFLSASALTTAALAALTAGAALCPLGYRDGAGYDRAARHGWAASSPAACDLAAAPPGVASSPALDGAGRAFLGAADGGVYCLDADTGAQLWRFSTRGPVVASCALRADGALLCTSFDGSLYALL